jgi:hypothetical protein
MNQNKRTNKRGSKKILENYVAIISEIRSSEQLNTFWKKYQKEFNYAKDIAFDDVCDTIQKIMQKLKSEEIAFEALL